MALCPLFNASAVEKAVAENGRASCVTATNVFNHPVWGTGLGFLTDANITSTTFGQTTGPANGARQMYVRMEVKF